MLSGPRQAKVDEGPRAPQGRVFHFTHHFPPSFFLLPCTPPLLFSSSAQWQPTSAGKRLRTCSGRGPGRHLLRYLASSPCMAAAVALWGGWGCLRVWEGYFRGPGQSTLTAEAVTVLRPAKLGGRGAAVTTVRPPAPPTAPGPLKHWSSPDPPRSTQGACAHATAAVCAGSVGGPGSRD